MIHALAKRIAAYCFQGSGRPRDDLEIIEFGVETRIADIVQVMILIAAAALLRSPGHVFCYSVCFMSVKCNVGGAHAKTHLACITTFTALAVCSVLLSHALPYQITYPLIQSLASIGLLLIWWKGPVAHPNFPKSAAARDKSRRTSLLIAGIQYCVLPLLSLLAPQQALAGAMGGLAAAISLVIPNDGKGGREIEGKRE